MWDKGVFRGQEVGPALWDKVDRGQGYNTGKRPHFTITSHGQFCLALARHPKLRALPSPCKTCAFVQTQGQTQQLRPFTGSVITSSSSTLSWRVVMAVTAAISSFHVDVWKGHTYLAMLRHSGMPVLHFSRIPAPSRAPGSDWGLLFQHEKWCLLAGLPLRNGKVENRKFPLLWMRGALRHTPPAQLETLDSNENAKTLPPLRPCLGLKQTSID